MYHSINLIFLLLPFIISQNFTNNHSSIKWISSSFGSSFSTLPCFYDINHDGTEDMITISVDGEIIVYDLSTGEALGNSNWPVYLSNDHFFSKPIMYIYGQKFNQEVVLFISHKGLIHFYDWKGMFINMLQIRNIFLNKNWSFIKFKALNEVLSFEKKHINSSLFYDLYPEVYADGKILDLNIAGISEDLIIPINFVSKNLNEKDVIVSAIVVYNLNSKSLLDVFPLYISWKNSESPAYLLSNVDVLDSQSYQLVVTSTSGTIYKLEWDRKQKKFKNLFDDSLVYNIGPHKCHVTQYCGNQNETHHTNRLCCIYIDYYGHMVMLNLNKPGSIWEYEFKDAGIPTETEIFIDNSSGDEDPFVIFATNQGWIHCVSLLTGMPRHSYPMSINNVSFSSAPKMVINSQSQLYVILLSDEGYMLKISLDNPENRIIVIHNEQISSFMSPIFLPISLKKFQSEIIIQSKGGFIFKYEIYNLKPVESLMSKTTSNAINPGYVSTLFGSGSSFSFNLQIHDQFLSKLDFDDFYTIKVYINENLYATQKDFRSKTKITETIVVVNLELNNPKTVFLFGTVTVKVSNSMGIEFPLDYFYIRINYDFQFELIWIVYLTFVICTFSILVMHFYDDNHKFYIPLYSKSIVDAL